jgi:hypothetical protein
MLPSKATLSPEDWCIVALIAELMEPFMEVQRALEGEKYITLSLVLPALCCLRKKLKQMQMLDLPDDCSQVQDLFAETGQLLMDDFEERWGKDSEVLMAGIHGPRGEFRGVPRFMVLACTLDPRVIPLLPKLMSKEDEEKVWKMLIDEAIKVMDQSLVNDGEEPRRRRVKKSADMDERGISRMFQQLGDCDEQAGEDGMTASKDCNIGAQEDRARSQIEVEVAAYKRESTWRGSDVLGWWKNRALLYPHIARVARRVLCVPATSVSSERLFSQAEGIPTDMRTRLVEGEVSALIFLHSRWGAEALKNTMCST